MTAPVSSRTGAPHSTARPDAIRLDGPRTQGGLLWGRVPPSSVVAFGGGPARVSKEGWFLVGFGRDAPPEAELEVTFPDGRHERLVLAVAPREYRTERIDGLPERRVAPRGEEELARIRREAELVRKARLIDDPRTDFLSGFRWPVQGRVSGVYGSQRILNGEPREPHYGIDIAAPAGTKVRAPADGLITLAEPDLFLSGGTLIIDHGHGLSSAFLHLACILAAPGRTGAAGRTRCGGRSDRPRHRAPPRLAGQPVRSAPRPPAPRGTDAEVEQEFRRRRAHRRGRSRRGGAPVERTEYFFFASNARSRRERGYGAGIPRFTVTLFFWVKLSSMPSSENSRPIPLCLTPP